MTQRQLSALLRLLRREGVSSYSDGAIRIDLRPEKPDAQDGQESSQKPPEGPDIGVPAGFDGAAQHEEITDPRAWLEERYRELRIAEHDKDGQ
jgi:hypothetical protein